MGEVAGRGQRGAGGGLAVAAPEVRGLDVDGETRCRHWHSPRDIVAIQMACCETWYACADCHAAFADHPLASWPVSERQREAILCGACGTTLSIAGYMRSGDCCPTCGAAFNPGCRSHYPLYFATEAPTATPA